MFTRTRRSQEWRYDHERELFHFATTHQGFKIEVLFGAMIRLRDTVIVEAWGYAPEISGTLVTLKNEMHRGGPDGLRTTLFVDCRDHDGMEDHARKESEHEVYITMKGFIYRLSRSRDDHYARWLRGALRKEEIAN